MANLVNLKVFDAGLEALAHKMIELQNQYMMHRKTWSDDQRDQVELLIGLQEDWIFLMKSLVDNNRDGRG